MMMILPRRLIGKLVVTALVAMFVIVMAAGDSAANRNEGIAAVVNDDVITYGDVYDRMDVVIKSSNLPDTKEFRGRILPQVLEGLINEQIQMQEAQRLDIDIQDAQVKEGFAMIAQQNKLEVDKFISILRRQGLPLSSMARQIRAQMGWNEVIQKKLRSQVTVSDQDVEAEIQRMKRMAGKTEYLLAEIFLPVREIGQDQKVQNFALRLVDQLRKGASFPSLAREFSASAGAAQGGMIGWVTEDGLEPEIAARLDDLGKNQLTSPVKTDRGYHILLLQDKRQIEFADPDDALLTIKELSLPISDAEGRSEDDARALANALTGCVDIELKAETWDGAKVEIFDLAAGKLSAEIRNQYLAQDIGQPFNADRAVTEDGMVQVEMICSKELPQGNLPDREAIRKQIGTKRMELLQRSYLRDLRSQAYIEQRIE